MTTGSGSSIGPGFGFPARFKVEASNVPDFRSWRLIADRTSEDFANPRLASVAFEFGETARYIRVTATKLAPRQNDYNFALAEVEILGGPGDNLARGAKVTPSTCSLLSPACSVRRSCSAERKIR